jgi:hypothetical protein
LDSTGILTRFGVSIPMKEVVASPETLVAFVRRIDAGSQALDMGRHRRALRGVD